MRFGQLAAPTHGRSGVADTIRPRAVSSAVRVKHRHSRLDVLVAGPADRTTLIGHHPGKRAAAADSVAAVPPGQIQRVTESPHRLPEPHHIPLGCRGTVLSRNAQGLIYAPSDQGAYTLETRILPSAAT